MVGIAIGSEASSKREACFAAGDAIEDAGGSYGPDDLCHDVGGKLRCGKAFTYDESD